MFFGVYIYLFSSIFRNRGGKDTEDFFLLMDSTPLNNTVMLNKTGPQIRKIAKSVLAEFTEMEDLSFWLIENYEKKNSPVPKNKKIEKA